MLGLWLLDLVGRREGLMGKAGGLGELSLGSSAGSTLAVGYRAKGCKGFSRMHTVVSCGCS